MSWKPVNGETWRKRKRPKYGVRLGPARVWAAPLGTMFPDDPAWREIGVAKEGLPGGWQVQTFGPGALFDSVVFAYKPLPPNPNVATELPDSWNA